jgi:hypothetical protein
VCTACPFDCLTCNSNGSCLTCSSDIDHRGYKLVGTFGRCLPLDGYYENGQTVAAQCATGCLNCSSADFCLQCRSGYALYNGRCSSAACLFSSYCLNCTSLTYCYNCVERAVFDYSFNVLNAILKCKPCPYDCYTCY